MCSTETAMREGQVGSVHAAAAARVRGVVAKTIDAKDDADEFTRIEAPKKRKVTDEEDDEDFLLPSPLLASFKIKSAAKRKDKDNSHDDGADSPSGRSSVCETPRGKKVKPTSNSRTPTRMSEEPGHSMKDQRKIEKQTLELFGGILAKCARWS